MGKENESRSNSFRSRTLPTFRVSHSFNQGPLEEGCFEIVRGLIRGGYGCVEATKNSFYTACLTTHNPRHVPPSYGGRKCALRGIGVRACAVALIIMKGMKGVYVQFLAGIDIPQPQGYMSSR